MLQLWALRGNQGDLNMKVEMREMEVEALELDVNL